MKRTCIQCGKEFELSNSEIGFYKKRKLSLPKRCKECRELNKKNENGKKNESAAAEANGKTAVEKKRETVSSGSETQKNRNHAAGAASSAEVKSCNCTQKKAKSGIKRTLVAAAVLVIAAVYSALSGNLPFGTNDGQQSSGVGQGDDIDYTFRTDDLFESHYEKHGIEMGFDSAEAYLEAANDVIDSPEALHKTEAEDGDDIYFLEETNEFVVLSTDGYIRTYYIADGGIEYYERQ